MNNKPYYPLIIILYIEYLKKFKHYFINNRPFVLNIIIFNIKKKKKNFIFKYYY